MHDEAHAIVCQKVSFKMKVIEGKVKTLASTKGQSKGVHVEKQTLNCPYNQQVNTHDDTKAVRYSN